MMEFLPLLLPVVLYAETHYKFRYFFSWLRKKEPEIIVDAPRFVEPGKPIPVLVLVKDAHLYPIEMQGITITVKQGGKSILSQVLARGKTRITERMWWRVFHVDRSDWTGWIDLEPVVEYRCGTSAKRCSVDNYKGSSRLPLNIYLSSDPRPRIPSLYYGDCHTHSSYTDDQVEYGAPLGASVELSKAMGLSFFCATDHSYDLDDSVDSYLENDPELPKWTAFQAEAGRLNSENESEFSIIRGEEISCRNDADENVHMLLLGDPGFFEGSGDSAEKWFRTHSQSNIRDILRAKSTDAIAIAAHPREPVPILQRLLLGRSEWSAEDLGSDGLDGVQFINGRIGRASEWGTHEWVRLLLKGKRTVAIAGTDAHGNFARFRQVGIPFLTIQEHHLQLFGQFATGVFLDGTMTENALIAALKKGSSIITNGPICALEASNAAGEQARIGDTLSVTPGGQEASVRLELTARSSRDFGEIESVEVLYGTVADDKELSVRKDLTPTQLELNLEVSFLFIRSGYLRCVVKTSAKNPFTGQPHVCMTNPIWIDPHRRSL